MIQYTIRCDKTSMLKKFPLDIINVARNLFFFLSRAPTHHSFTFNLRFLYELKHKFVSLKLCVGFSIFDSVLFLFKVYIFVRQNA